MAVQIPTLKRVNAPGPTSVGRVEVQTPDFAKAAAPQSQAFNKLAETAVDYVAKEEEYAIGIKATEADNKFETLYRNRLAEGNSITGDPTAFYQSLEEESRKWEEEVVTGYSAGNSRLEMAIKEKLAKTKQHLYEKQATKQASQYAAYEENVKKSKIGLIHQGMMDAIETIDPNDESTFSRLNVHVNEIRGLIRARAAKNENGEPIVDEIMRNEENTEIGKGLKNVIETLNSLGLVEHAEAVMNRYPDEILASDKAKLVKGTQSATEDRKALAFVKSIRHLSPEDAMKRVSTIEDDVVRRKTMKFLDEEQRIYRNSKEREQKAAEEDILNIIDSQQKAGRPIGSITQLEQDPRAKSLLPRLSPKGRKAIYEMIDSPKESDPVAKQRAFEVMFSGGFEKMSTGEFQELMVGLDKPTRQKLETRYMDARHQSPSEKNAATRYMGTRLKEVLVSQGILKQKPNGRLSNKENKKLNMYYEKMLETIEAYPPGTSMADQNKYVRQLVSDYIAGKDFQGAPGATQRRAAPARGGARPGAAAPKKKSSFILRQQPQNIQDQWLNKFKEEHGYEYDYSKAGMTMQEYVDRNNGEL